MEDIKMIENILLNKSIRKYRIISLNTKRFWYRDSFNNIFYDSFNLSKFIIIFNYKDKISQFTTTNTNIKLIKSLIDSCSQSTCNNLKWVDNGLAQENTHCKITFEKNIFDNFDDNYLFSLIKKKFKVIKKSINFKINSFYSFGVMRQRLLTEKIYCEQFHVNSNLLSMENTTFEKRVNIDNILPYERFQQKIINAFNEDSFPLNPQFTINTPIVIKKSAVKDLLNNFVPSLYSSNVYNNQSFIEKSYIGKKLFKKNFDLISLPFENIQFDLDGMRVCEKNLIVGGKLTNFLSNITYSQYLNIKSYGNTDFSNSKTISHQRLKFILNERPTGALSILDNYVTICKFESLTFDFKEKSIYGLATFMYQGKKFNSPFSFNLFQFFNHIYPFDNNYCWVDNVYCSDIIFHE